ncbi:hypothetical protein JM654_18890 [Microbacterium oxydans]|nr:hypothetical protein [Microbacterium oxydans]
MNYWGAETADLPESHEALATFIREVAVPSRVATRNAFGADVRGWTARTSQSIFGGNSWEWNTIASAWYAQHLYEHWAFTQAEVPARPRLPADQGDLPVLGGPAQRASRRHAGRADGLVSGARSARGRRQHDQQIIWDLFQNYLECAEALGADKTYRKTVADMQSRLAQQDRPLGAVAGVADRP